MHAASRGKGWRQAERAREAGERNLAAFSVARFAGLFSPLLPPTAWSPRRLGQVAAATRPLRGLCSTKSCPLAPRIWAPPPVFGWLTGWFNGL